MLRNYAFQTSLGQIKTLPRIIPICQLCAKTEADGKRQTDRLTDDDDDVHDDDDDNYNDDDYDDNDCKKLC